MLIWMSLLNLDKAVFEYTENIWMLTNAIPTEIFSWLEDNLIKQQLQLQQPYVFWNIAGFITTRIRLLALLLALDLPQTTSYFFLLLIQ